MNRKTAVAALAVLSAGALLLSACAGGGTPTNTSPAPSEQPTLATVAYEQVPGSDVKQGGTLNLSILSTPTDEGNWNPNHAKAANVEVQNLLAPTLGNLGEVTEDGKVVANPNYATSVELTSESPQVVTVKLNDKAVWEDGSPITADDWKATLDSAGNTDDGYEVIPSSVFAQIDKVEVVSDAEFTVSFKATFADWANLMLVPVIPASIANDKDAFNTGYTNKPIPTAGPYKVDKVDNDAAIYTMVPNPNWWGEDKPKLDSITWKRIAQEALPQSFANDEIDYLEIQTPDALATAESKSGAVIQRSGGLTWSHLTFNGKSAPFDDANVRKAVASAIDRELIAQVANTPLGAPAATLGDWIFMPGQDGYIDAFGEKYQRSEEKVKEYLEASGYTKNGQNWEKDGQKLTFAIIVPAGTQSNINRALGIQDALKEFGIEVTIDESPAEDYFVNISEGKYQAATFGWQGTPFPISSSETIYYPEQEFGDQNGQNYSFFTDDRLKPLFDKANAELDPAARIKIANEISGVIADYLPSIPIYPYPEVAATDEGLVNFGKATFKSTDWSIVGYKG
ncbi:ABC transporter family substrate-binding protein [Microbacterium sp.]|uniref:ABC transporter family substrate-binding protein n=1 Tax=Microbacterium sp. TaxID=51671 RepID=UPI0039E5DAA0